MKVELIYSPGCVKCADARADLKAAARKSAGEYLIWRELNVLEELDYAVALGVLTLPAIAIDGKLVFTSLPTPERFREELKRRAAKAK